VTYVFTITVRKNVFILKLKKERKAILNCDWPIRLLLTSFCFTFMYVPWA